MVMFDMDIISMIYNMDMNSDMVGLYGLDMISLMLYDMDTISIMIFDMDMISMIYNRDMISIMVYDMNMISMMIFDMVMSFGTVYDREFFSMICIFGQVFYDNIQH